MIWSVSQHRTWERCQLQCFFGTVLANAKATAPLRKRAFTLKQIQHLAWWPGRVVHTAIQRWIMPSIRAGTWPATDHVIAQAQRLGQRQFQFSQAGEYLRQRKRDAEDAFCILKPHYFAEPVAPDTLDRALASIAQALTNLLDNDQMRAFLLGRAWYRFEYALTTRIDGITIRAVPDLLMPSLTGGLDIVDWKVATAASNYHFQVGVYALTALATERLAPYARAGLACYVINLLDSNPAATLDDPYLVDDDAIVDTTDAIYESMERMRPLLHDRSHIELQPNQFEYAASPGTCALCNWRNLCMEVSDGSPAESLSYQQCTPTQLALPLD